MAWNWITRDKYITILNGNNYVSEIALGMLKFLTVEASLPYRTHQPLYPESNTLGSNHGENILPEKTSTKH